MSAYADMGMMSAYADMLASVVGGRRDGGGREPEETLGGGDHHRADGGVVERLAGGGLDAEAVDQAEDLQGGHGRVFDREGCGGIYGIDILLRRNRYDGLELHDETPASRFWYWRGVHPAGAIAMIGATAAALLCVNTSVLVGPVPRA